MKGVYVGELKNGREPHGLGKWKAKDYDITVMGEWKDGKLIGKAVKYWFGDPVYYEMKDGKIDGRFISRG